MPRWEPDGRARLQAAALELFAAQGFAETTTAGIAERAGLTERTFFRHFADKREALFGGEGELRDALVEAVADTPTRAPDALVLAGLLAIVSRLQPRHAELRRRGEVVALHPELQERELAKLASWTVALEAALRARRVAQPELLAGVAITVLDVAARQWLAVATPTSLAQRVRRGLSRLPVLVPAGG